MHQKILSLLTYFRPREYVLWLSSMAAIVLSYALTSGGGDALSLAASLVGVTSLVFAARGNPAGPALMVVFSILYGVISYSFRYFGEMATYLGMTLPMSVCAVVTWMKHRYTGAEVRVNVLSRREYGVMWLLTALVTFAFYWILRALGTANLIPSTISVTTSFLAVYLTLRRSPLYALGYAANDVVLVALWVMAAMTDRSYLSMVVCFAVFLANDLYGFFSWRAMGKRQSAEQGQMQN